MSIAPRLPRLFPCPTCGAPPGDVAIPDEARARVKLTDSPSTVRSLPRYVEEHPKCSSCSSLLTHRTDDHDWCNDRNPGGYSYVVATPSADYCSNHSELRKP